MSYLHPIVPTKLKEWQGLKLVVGVLFCLIERTKREKLKTGTVTYSKSLIGSRVCGRPSADEAETAIDRDMIFTISLSPQPWSASPGQPDRAGVRNTVLG